MVASASPPEGFGATPPRAGSSQGPIAVPPLPARAQSTSAVSATAASAARRRRPRHDIESLDYDIDASSIFELELQQQPNHVRRQIAVGRWAVCLVVGVATGIVAFTLDVLGGKIVEGKWLLAARGARGLARVAGGHWAAAFLGATGVFLGLSVALVALAAYLVVYVEPVAGGSGIPEVKTYLSGCKVPRLLRTTTLVCKTVGVLCAVCGGLVVGKEGPMIHTGAIIAAGLSQGSSKTCNLRTMWLKRFRNDHDKRDFVSAGAAAGVAAAFGAPIGGVLFAMEEAAAFWSQQLTWRTFFCAMCSTFTLNLLLSAEVSGTPFGRLSHPGLITFGASAGVGQGELYGLHEIPVFMLIGVAGGLLGAGFNALNERLTKWRARRLPKRRARFAEALLLATLTAVLVCCLPLAMPCSPTAERGAPPAAAPPGSPPHPPIEPLPEPNALQAVMHPLVCGREGFTSDAVTLLLGSHEAAIKTLFHAPATPSADADPAREAHAGRGPHPKESDDGGAGAEGIEIAGGLGGAGVCALFFCFSFGLSLVTYGAMVPSGLFVPAIMAGGSLGRLVGEILHRFLPAFNASAPGNYALIGAAAMLGGICRMTISITVIVVEATTNVAYLIPISVTIVCAKLVGDLFNAGIYDLHVHLKRYPVLPDAPARDREPLAARDIMSAPVKTISEVEQVGTLVKLLRSTTHHGFPVVSRGGGHASGGSATLPSTSAAQPRVLGIILRDQLSTLLAKRVFDHGPPPSLTAPPAHLAGLSARAGPSAVSAVRPPLTADDFMRPWFSSLPLDQLGLTREDMSAYVDLRPYVNEAALVTLQNASLRRVTRLFRTMGLRHLLVIESCPKVVGMITRKDVIYGGSGPQARADPLDAADTDLSPLPLDGAEHEEVQAEQALAAMRLTRGESASDWRGGINSGRVWWKRASAAMRTASASLIQRAASSSNLATMGGERDWTRSEPHHPRRAAGSLYVAGGRALSVPLLADAAAAGDEMRAARAPGATPVGGGRAARGAAPAPGLSPLVAPGSGGGGSALRGARPDMPLVDCAADRWSTPSSGPATPGSAGGGGSAHAPTRGGWGVQPQAAAGLTIAAADINAAGSDDEELTGATPGVIPSALSTVLEQSSSQTHSTVSSSDDLAAIDAANARANETEGGR